MDSLLCEEVCPSTPTSSASTSTPDSYHNQSHYSTNCNGQCYPAACSTKEDDCQHALSVYRDKELTYMPQPGYLQLLRSKHLFFARFRAIYWLLKSGRRLNLSHETIFSAANYLDRFISTNECHGWKYWMVELLAAACLSVASKFSETHVPCLHEIQMEGLDHSFQPITIQRMELMLLEALGWRLVSTTPFSYIELLTLNIDSLTSFLRNQLVSRLTEVLLGAMLDGKLVEYRPSIAAASALWCTLEELIPSKSDHAHLGHIIGLLDLDHKGEKDLIRCHSIMEAHLISSPAVCNLVASAYYCPPSPVTVLATQPINIYDCNVDFSFFNCVSGSNKNQERCNKKPKISIEN